jgi:hypothetical protein
MHDLAIYGDLLSLLIYILAYPFFLHNKLVNATNNEDAMNLTLISLTFSCLTGFLMMTLVSIFERRYTFYMSNLLHPGNKENFPYILHVHYCDPCYLGVGRSSVS